MGKVLGFIFLLFCAAIILLSIAFVSEKSGPQYRSFSEIMLDQRYEK